MNSRFCALLVLAFFLGCEGWQSVLIESEDFEPQLNVLAILSPDEGGTIEIQVQRTLPLEGPEGEEYGDPDTVCYYSEYDSTTYCYETRPWISYYKVTDATVTLSDGDAIYPFVYDSTQKANGDPGMWDAAQARGYVPVDTTFVPLSGATYVLEVEALDSLEVSGSCTIPPPLEIKVDQLPDTLRSGELFTVAWNPVTDYVRVKIEPVEEQPFRAKYCFVWEEAIVRKDSSITFLIVPECWEEEDPFGPDMEADTLDPNVDYLEVEIVVTAMDERYYNYFYGGDMGPDYEEIMFIFLGEGDTGRNQGIEGGLGIFASFRSSSVRRFIKL